MPEAKPELIELVNRNNSVVLIKKNRPEEFTEKFSLLLSETPIDLTLKPEFLIYAVLGAALF